MHGKLLQIKHLGRGNKTTLFYKKLRIKIVVSFHGESAPWLKIPLQVEWSINDY